MPNEKKPSFLKSLFTRKKKEPTLNKSTFNTFVPSEKNAKIESLKTAIKELEKVKRDANQRTDELGNKIIGLDEKIKNIEAEARVLVIQKKKNLAMQTLKRTYPLKNGKNMTAELLRSSKNISRKADLEIKRAKGYLQKLQPTNGVNQWGSENVEFPPMNQGSVLKENNFDPFPKQEQWNWSVLNAPKPAHKENVNWGNFKSLKEFNHPIDNNLLNLAHVPSAKKLNNYDPFASEENSKRKNAKEGKKPTVKIIGRYPRQKTRRTAN